MEILFVTSEIAPFSKVGGLADVCGALPKALRSLGHKVTVLSPLYAGIDPQQRSLARRLMRIEFEIAGKKTSCELYDGRTAAGVDLLFLGNEEIFRGGGTEVYTGTERDAVRFGALCKGAIEVLRQREPRFEVIHAHDWPAALTLVLAKRHPELRAIPGVLTIHNLAHQGTFPKATMEALGLPWELFNPEGLEFYDQVNLLKGGILAADRITTVSPTYAKEILTKEGGSGLDGVLRAHADKLVGVLNGVDASVWNPATDPQLTARFDPIDLGGKARCKAALQLALGLPVRTDVALIGSVGRLAPQKGYDLFAKCAAQLLKNDVQVALLGDGDPELVEVLAELSHRWPDRFQVRGGQDEKLAHAIVAGSDLFVIPSRFEPCGLTQMYAHRYGSLPIARRTGGLADTIVDADAKLESGTGFLYDEATPQALLGAMRRGIAAFADADAFEKLQRRVMRVDHSWERSARIVERVYRDAAAQLAPKT